MTRYFVRWVCDYCYRRHHEICATPDQPTQRCRWNTCPGTMKVTESCEIAGPWEPRKDFDADGGGCGCGCIALLIIAASCFVVIYLSWKLLDWLLT